MRSFPRNFKLYNACSEPCDVIGGFCVCGAWHSEEGVREKILKIALTQDIPTVVLLTDEDSLIRQVGEAVQFLRSLPK